MAHFITYEDILATVRLGNLIRLSPSAKCTPLAEEFLKNHPELISKIAVPEKSQTFIDPEKRRQMKKRIPLIAGNWKMHKTVAQSVALVKELIQSCADVSQREILVCPPTPSLALIYELLKNSNIKLGAQNLHWESEGAFTGEISGAMLKDAGVECVIVGHSERRQYFGETDEWVNKKMKAAYRHGLIPIVCVGETLQQREKGDAFKVVERQMRNGTSGLNPEQATKLVIAYEPVWAIGTGKTATPQQAQEMHFFIRKLLSELYGKETAEKIRILYGGSIKPDNIDILMAQPDIDGGLVGGASLKAEDFTRIVRYQ